MHSKHTRLRPPRKTYSNFIIGFRALQEAVQSGKEIDKVLIQKGLKGQLHSEIMHLLKEHNIPWQQVPQEKLDGMTRGNHQGVGAFVSPIGFAFLEEIIPQIFEAGKNPKLILLDGVTDVRNFGAICRSAECQGFDAVIIPEKGSAQINEDAVKTSAGALFHIPLCRVKSVKSAMELLQQSGIQLVGCTEKTEDLLYSVNFELPTCIIMGAEDLGISDEALRKSDRLAKIPMFGQTSSLNVSVAAGIIMYELTRQRLLVKS